MRHSLKALDQPKYGVYADYGILGSGSFALLSSEEKKLVTLKEYVSRMKEDQKDIYYACGGSIARIEQLPQTELLRDKGYEILFPDRR